MGVAYAFVDGQWLTCTADAFLQVQGRSEREWELILSEWREQQRAHHRKRVSIDSSRLAAFLEEMLAEESLLEQQQRDLEGVSIRDAIAGRTRSMDPELGMGATEADDELDLPPFQSWRSIATMAKLEPEARTRLDVFKAVTVKPRAIASGR